MAREMVATDAFVDRMLSFRTGTTIGQIEDIAFTIDIIRVPELCNVYGSLETYGNCAATDSTLPRETRLETQGRPLAGQQNVVVDPDPGDRPPPGEVGEIRVGGRIAPGYHNATEQNQERF